MRGHLLKVWVLPALVLVQRRLVHVRPSPSFETMTASKSTAMKRNEVGGKEGSSGRNEKGKKSGWPGKEGPIANERSEDETRPS